MDERLTEVEIHLMHLEEMVGELNQVVIRQQAWIAGLEGELAKLRKELAKAAEPMTRRPEEEEPPPHY